MQITDALLTISNYNRPGSKRIRTTAIACHYIGNPGTSAKNNRNWFESLKDGKGTKASCHYIIGLQGEILRLIPEDEISWCTNQANSYTISIEACHTDATGKFMDATYKAYVELCADLCARWHLDPIAGGLVRHYDVTGKMCPKWFVDHPDAWERFKWDVLRTMSQSQVTGWIQDNVGWWYRHEDGGYTTNGWEEIAGKWYWFDGAGYAVESSWYEYKDQWYYLGADCAMVTGLQVIAGNAYHFEQSGAMTKEPVTITLKPDADGVLSV